MIMRINSALALMALMCSSAFGTTKVSFDAANNPVINGKTIFPISVAVLPPVDGKTPTGESAWQEFSQAGVNFARVAPGDYWDKHGWNPEGLRVAGQYMDQLAAANIYAWMTLGDELSYVKPDDAAETGEAEGDARNVQRPSRAGRLERRG